MSTGIDKCYRVLCTGVNELIKLWGASNLSGLKNFKVNLFNVELDNLIRSVKNSGWSINILLSIMISSNCNYSTFFIAFIESNLDILKY